MRAPAGFPAVGEVIARAPAALAVPRLGRPALPGNADRHVPAAIRFPGGATRARSGDGPCRTRAAEETRAARPCSRCSGAPPAFQQESADR